jgi:hypothetical protein
LGRSLGYGVGLRLRLGGGSVRCMGLLIGVWRWMRGYRISMLLGGLGYRGIHQGSLLIRFGSGISIILIVGGDGEENRIGGEETGD